MDESTRPRLRDGMRAASMLALGPLLFGISFGLLAETAGMGATATVIFSATTFAGSAWIVGTAIGTLVGNRLGTPEDYGLDGVFAAPFLGLALPTLRGHRAREAAALAAVIVGLVGVVTVLLKATGPVLLGGRRLAGRPLAVVELLAPVMLVALVVTQTIGGDRSLVLDARLAGVGAAAVALRLRAPLVVAMVIAAVVTALLRHVAI